MREPFEVIKSQVRALRPYSLRADRARIKLNQNENPSDLPIAIKQEILRRIAARRWSRYPDFVPKQLHQKLAEHVGWIAEGVIAGNGSNELIQALLMVTVGAGKRVLINEPTFALYRQISTILGAEVVSVPLTSQLGYDTAALTAEIEVSKPEVTIVCSPNNPTGCVITRPDLVALLESTEALVVVDEAYGEFSGETTVPLLERYSNLVVLRTFSKAMAMAGLRVGFLLAAPDLAREIRKAVLPYNLNLISQTAAEVALEMYSSSLKPMVRDICAERDRLYVAIKAIEGLSPLPSRANFLLVRSAIAPSSVYELLLQRDVLIRDVSSYAMLHDCFRVSVGTPEENDGLVAALSEIFAGEQVKGMRA